MPQTTFAEEGFEKHRKMTFRETFLDEMNQIVPWAELAEAIEPFYPVPDGAGRRQLASSGCCASIFFSSTVVQPLRPGGRGSAVRVTLDSSVRGYRSRSRAGRGRGRDLQVPQPKHSQEWKMAHYILRLDEYVHNQKESIVRNIASVHPGSVKTQSGAFKKTHYEQARRWQTETDEV